jgi:hypothetical protein
MGIGDLDGRGPGPPICWPAGVVAFAVFAVVLLSVAGFAGAALAFSTAGAALVVVVAGATAVIGTAVTLDSVAL